MFSVSDPPTTGSRKPRLRAIAETGQVLNVLSARLVSTDNLTADRFYLVAVLSGSASKDRSLWAKARRLTIDIQVSPDDTAAFETVIAGPVDTIVFDPIRNIIEIQGRDFSSLLIQSPICQTYANQTSSEIISSIALAHGLIPNISPTASMIGRVDASGHVQMSLPRHTSIVTHWDLLVELARSENYHLFVKNRTLHFHPSLPAPAIALRTIDCRKLIDLRVERILSPTAATALMVESWNARTQSTVHLSQAIGEIDSASQHDSAFRMLRPNMTALDASRLIAQQMRDMARNRVTVVFTQPGDLSLMPRDYFYLSETHGLDGIYQVSTIERKYHPRNGFLQCVTAQPPG